MNGKKQPKVLGRLNEPKPVYVRVNAAGDPVAVRRKKPDWTRCEVQERWRVDEGWWRQPVERHYYQLVLPNGGLLTVFRDGIGGGWYAQPAG